MSQKVYILMMDGEPQYVTTDLNIIHDECYDWFQQHHDDYDIYKKFNYWVEDRTEFNKYDDDDYRGEELAWNAFVDEQFDNGTWGRLYMV